MAGLEASGGGTHLWQQYQLADYSAMNRAGTMPLQFILDAMLGALTFDHDADDYADGCLGRSFQPQAGGALDVDVRPGLALWHDSAASDDYDIHYKPIFLDVETTKTADVADGALDRYDRITAAPLYTNDKSATRYFKDPTTQVISTNSVATRRRYAATLTYTAGTPGGTYPAIPAGHIPIAKFKVAAAAGSISDLYDERVQLAFPGQFPVILGPRAFQSLDGADEADRQPYGASDKWLGTGKGAGVTHELVAELPNLHDLKITTMELRADGTAADDAITARLVRISKDSVSKDTLATIALTGADAGSGTVDLPAGYAVVNQADYSYCLELDIENNSGAAYFSSVRFY